MSSVDIHQGDLDFLSYSPGVEGFVDEQGSVDCFSSTDKNQMKRDIYCISIHAELQPRTNVDGEGDAEQIKEQSETNYKELCQLWKDFRSERDEGKLRFRTILLFYL